MSNSISIELFLQQHSLRTLIDVRSPGEFIKGHIPGAINIPLFSNDERAKVGTAYVQKSKELAIEIGLEIVKPKLQWFLDETRKHSSTEIVTVHCWRGGMRSQSFAEHLSENGFEKVEVIEGGYKSFRKYVLQFFEQKFNLKVIGGYTGSGKTYILHEIEKQGFQIVDLEGLASHKGSAFGFIGQGKQPSVEQFENNLFHSMKNLNLDEQIWIEDESHNIGMVRIPMPLYTQIRAQNVIFINIPSESRVEHLVSEYSKFGDDVLEYALNGIAKRMGGQNMKLAKECLSNKNYSQFASLALDYYDKAYLKGVRNRPEENVKYLNIEDVNHYKNAQRIVKYAKENN